MGWVAPLMHEIGMEVSGHEHNHRGQCWWEIRSNALPKPDVGAVMDIRRDPRWRHGYLDRFVHHRKLPLLQEVSRAADPAELMFRWFSQRSGPVPRIVSDARYVGDDATVDGVLIGDAPVELQRLADRFLATVPAARPLLMHTYFPMSRPIDFSGFGLPRPVPVLPFLLRRGYTHRPHNPPPSCEAICTELNDILESA
jgi:hypothetical protein